MLVIPTLVGLPFMLLGPTNRHEKNVKNVESNLLEFGITP